ncbi:uncharacterized protein LOC124915460 [Impatiens glandulifera]|uniref:uncharacterized protein LOC124915460 n=1 Tax=Impatiens glandulifera TaxID=253017 RepID=UPI001FB1181F|nr:uncharacterized protein LOC124915460 [Impatiens glandulifera]
MEGLTEEERKALRGSKFAPLPSASRPTPRVAHAGGPLTTNKAAALAKFLERKLQDPNGLASLNPKLIEMAVKRAKNTVVASNQGGTKVRHVDKFDDVEVSLEEEEAETTNQTKQKKMKKKNKNKKKKKEKQVLGVVPGDAVCKVPKKKKKLL